MLRIVLPAAIPVVPISAVDVGVPISTVDVGIFHIIIIVIYGYVVIAAAVSPAGVATPSSATPGRANGQSDAERNGCAGNVGARRRVVDGRIGIHRWAVDHDRVVGGNIHDLWIGLLNHDDGFTFHRLGFHLHLLVGFQVPGALSLHAHTLDRIHHI